ncbi:MAG: DUF1292 domain-containing protein [Lachnospiraceae bacterium]
MFEKLVFTDENGEEEEFYVLEQTRVNGTDYLLVADDMEEAARAMIVKDISKPRDSEAVYEVLEDENEIKSISAIFNELLEDIEVE